MWLDVTTVIWAYETFKMKDSYDLHLDSETFCV